MPTASSTTAAWVALSATVALAGLGYAAWESFRRLRSLEHRLSERERRSRVHKPALIVLVRHGESEANVDPAKYCSVGDVHVRLTPKGREQAIAAAETLAKLVGDRSVFSYVSPYKRTKETAGLLLDRLPKGQVVAVREDPRLREREFAGSFQRSDAAIDRRCVYSLATSAFSFFYLLPPSLPPPLLVLLRPRLPSSTTARRTASGSSSGGRRAASRPRTSTTASPPSWTRCGATSARTLSSPMRWWWWRGTA